MLTATESGQSTRVPLHERAMAQWRREKVLQWGGGLQNSKNERGQRPEDVEAMGGLKGVVG
jgi:hypothetical protein